MPYKMMIDVGRLDKTKPYRFADIVEIFAAFSDGSPISTTDMYTMGRTSINAPESLLPLEEPDVDDNDYSDNISETEINAREQRYADDCFDQLVYRAGHFGDGYPFDLEGDRIRLKKCLTAENLQYLFLLFASRSRTFDAKGIRQRLGDAFEVVCKTALQNLMNPSAEVIMFGPNSDDRKSRFGSNLKTALPRLAEFMGVDMAPSWKKKNQVAQGDGKIDLVGVQRLDDFAKGWNVYLGQCAAHEDPKTWEKKRMEADIDNHKGKFHCLVKSQGVLFIPSCYRQSNGLWESDDDASNVILMDRVRILFHINDNEECQDFVRQFLKKEFQFVSTT